jgi:putative toxin-antitoxin system antitoxin component (TIGR02293 family)
MRSIEFRPKFVDTCPNTLFMATKDINIKQKLDREVSTIIKRSHIDKKFLYSKGDITYSNFLSDKMLMILVIREGIPYSLFNLIRHQTPFSENDWANFLDISTKSLQRYKQSSKSFKPIQSEKIIEMAEVTNVGLDVFGDMEKFKLWLDTPNFALGNLKPIELLKDSYGKEMVISELTRINYGILA